MDEREDIGAYQLDTIAAGNQQQGHGGQVAETSHGTVTPTAAPRTHSPIPPCSLRGSTALECDLTSWRFRLAFYLRAGEKVALRQHATILPNRVAVGADLLLLRNELGLARNPIH